MVAEAVREDGDCLTPMSEGTLHFYPGEARGYCLLIGCVRIGIPDERLIYLGISTR